GLVDHLKVLQPCVTPVAVGFEHKRGDPIAGLERHEERRVVRHMGVGAPDLCTAPRRIGDQDERSLHTPRRWQRDICYADRAGVRRVWWSVRWNLRRAGDDIAACSDEEK